MIIKVKIRPNSARQEVIKIKEEENAYIIYLKQEARQGKANVELINLLAKYFKTCVGNIKIRGKTSKEKIVEIMEVKNNK